MSPKHLFICCCSRPAHSHFGSHCGPLVKKIAHPRANFVAAVAAAANSNFLLFSPLTFPFLLYEYLGKFPQSGLLKASYRMFLFYSPVLLAVTPSSFLSVNLLSQCSSWCSEKKRFPSFRLFALVFHIYICTCCPPLPSQPTTLILHSLPPLTVRCQLTQQLMHHMTKTTSFLQLFHLQLPRKCLICQSLMGRRRHASVGGA